MFYPKYSHQLRKFLYFWKVHYFAQITNQNQGTLFKINPPLTASFPANVWIRALVFRLNGQILSLYKPYLLCQKIYFLVCSSCFAFFLPFSSVLSDSLSHSNGNPIFNKKSHKITSSCCSYQHHHQQYSSFKWVIRFFLNLFLKISQIEKKMSFALNLGLIMIRILQFLDLFHKISRFVDCIFRGQDWRFFW